MSIRITIAGGPLDGRVYRFADSRLTVTVGRHPSCDVVFPSDMIVVSRHHLALERKLARYRLLMQADNPVWIDGEEAFEGDELPLAAKLTLGRLDGPSLLVETIEDDSLPRTERHSRHDSPGRAAAKAVRRSRSLRRMMAALAVALAVVASGLGWLYWDDRREAARLLAEAYDRQGPGSEEEVAGRLRLAARSVYLVAAKDEYGITPVGTAFVVAPGILATSAHVAELFGQMGEGLEMVVRSAEAPPRDFAVAAMDMHPHYRRFEDTWRSYGPRAAGAGGESREITEAGGYDVALLRVAPEDAAHLAPPLPLAADADLALLEPGAAVGYVGFPIESAALGGVNLDNPEAQLQIGRLTALTDFFLVKSEPGERHLLQHSLPVQGGASGSPLIDHRGQVVGVVSGGNLVEIDANGTRVPTGIGVNFAQRADLVRELLAGDAESRIEDRSQLWQRRLKGYQNEVDVALADWAGSHGAIHAPSPLFQADGVVAAQSRYEMPAFVQRYRVPKPGWYLFLATAPGRENIDMMVVENPAAAGPRLVGLDQAPDHYPAVEFSGEPGAELELVVPGPPGAAVRLRVYWLPAGRG